MQRLFDLKSVALQTFYGFIDREIKNRERTMKDEGCILMAER